MSSAIPTRVLAGITVPDTPLITSSIAFAKDHLNPMAFNHVMRSFLFGFAIASKNPSASSRDLEAHAVSAILHDQGWDTTGALVSKDKRFEVDGANAARAFLAREAPDWDKHRVQLVWDAIAIHTTGSLALHKEVEVAGCHLGIVADFAGPDGTNGGLTWKEYEGIVKEFPRLKMADGIVEILCGFCRDKPETTYDNFVGDVGEKFVEGYSRVGTRFLDRVELTRQNLD